MVHNEPLPEVFCRGFDLPKKPSINRARKKREALARSDGDSSDGDRRGSDWDSSDSDWDSSDDEPLVRPQKQNNSEECTTTVVWEYNVDGADNVELTEEMTRLLDNLDVGNAVDDNLLACIVPPPKKAWSFTDEELMDAVDNMEEAPVGNQAYSGSLDRDDSGRLVARFVSFVPTHYGKLIVYPSAALSTIHRPYKSTEYLLFFSLSFHSSIGAIDFSQRCRSSVALNLSTQH